MGQHPRCPPAGQADHRGKWTPHSHTASPGVLSSASGASLQLDLSLLLCEVRGEHLLPGEREAMQLGPPVLPHRASPLPHKLSASCLVASPKPRTGPGTQQAPHNHRVNESALSGTWAGAQGT